MKVRVVARRYAEAFFKVIEGPKLDEIYRDFAAFAEIACGTGELAVALRHPTVKYEQKQSLVNIALKGASSQVIADFSLLLIKRHRFEFFSIIVEEVEILYRKAKSIVCVQVRSAVPLRDEEARDITAKLGRKVNGTIELVQKVDPDVKGGLIISYEDKILDASVKTRLKHLKEKLTSLSTELLDALEETPAELS